MMQIHDFKVIQNRPIGSNYFVLRLQHEGQLLPIEPGQFVEVQVPDTNGVMLRRPISVHDVDAQRGILDLLVQQVGKGTRRLAQVQPGACLNLVYPLGHGFSLDIPATSRVLLVGGGAGIAPLYHLAKELSGKGIRAVALLGGRTASLIPVSDEFAPYAAVEVSTDDGSRGHHGVVTTHPVFEADYDMIYTCGPTPMMKAVARSAAARSIRCEVSLENMMACGLGACLCCVTPTDNGHRCVCKDGPVFDISQMKQWYE